MAVISKLAAGVPDRSAAASKNFKVGICNIVSLAVALGLWQLGALLVASPFFPAPIKIAEAFVQLLMNGDTSGYSLCAHS